MQAITLDRMMTEREAATEFVSPFANGTQFSDWESSNCQRCTKRWDEITNTFHCEIDAALTIARCDDGRVTKAIADRMGYSDPLVYCWMCPEVEWTEEWKAAYRRKHGEPTDDN